MINLENISTFPLKGMRIGVMGESFLSFVEPVVSDCIKYSVQKFRDLGATVEIIPVKTNWMDICLSAYYTIATAEASSNLARYDGVRYMEGNQQYWGKSDSVVENNPNTSWYDTLQRRVNQFRKNNFGNEVFKVFMRSDC